MKRQPTQKQLETQRDAFNYNFKVGEIVNVTDDFGEINKDVIYHEATIVSGSVCAWLEDYRCYLAERVSKL